MAKAEKAGVCQTAYALIRAGRTNQQVLAAIGKKFPKSAFGMASVAWCRNKLRREEKGIKTNRELTADKPRARKKAAAAQAAA